MKSIHTTFSQLQMINRDERMFSDLSPILKSGHITYKDEISKDSNK